MKLVTGVVLLGLLVGTPARAFQDPDKDKDKPKPAQQEEPKRQEEPKPQERPQEKQPEEKHQQDQAKQQQEKQNKDTQKQQEQAEKAKQQTDKQQQQARRQEPANVPQAQRDGGNGNARTIREQDFHSHFGSGHRFRVARRDDRRFAYSGYSFEYTEAWPIGWSYDDDVYVDEIDGQYYLIDPVHPGLRLLVIVVG